MKARCVGNRGIHLSSEYLAPRLGYTLDSEFWLTVGETYTVYAIGIDRGLAWLYVADDQFVDGPRQYPRCLFELVDDSVSSHWHLRFYDGDSTEHAILFAPERWVQDCRFFEKVVNGELEAVRLFKDMKGRLDGEQ